MNGYA
jgi:hypothetical protein